VKAKSKNIKSENQERKRKTPKIGIPRVRQRNTKNKNKEHQEQKKTKSESQKHHKKSNMEITYIKRRMKLPFNLDGQWLRTVAKYSETCTWLPKWFVPLQH
jgi:hypothetical protein